MCAVHCSPVLRFIYRRVSLSLSFALFKGEGEEEEKLTDPFWSTRAHILSIAAAAAAAALYDLIF